MRPPSREPCRSAVGRCSEWVFRLVPTEWGHFGIVCDTDGRVVATYLPQPKNDLRRLIATRHPGAIESTSAVPVFSRQVHDYFAGKNVHWEVELSLGAIAGFRRRVLEACRRIPYGATVSYADLARTAGSPGAARAVGGAMASNPLPLIIPCHRVICSDGSIGGFSSPLGLTQKERLLRHENPGRTTAATRNRSVQKASCATARKVACA